jgi:transposase InsO family protein
MAIVKVLKH